MQISGFGLTLESVIRAYGEDAGALAQAASHHFSAPGKRTRSQLLFATSVEPKNHELLIHAAAAVELIHEASIVHDDIQDGTEVRRGQPSVWKKFGANTALLLGDHFVSAAFRTIAEVSVEPATHAKLIIILSHAISRAASGQHLQLSSTTQHGDLSKIYKEVAVSKTGAFIALPLQFSNLIGHADVLDSEPARLCGEQLGLAYQILDDLRPFAAPSTLASDEDMVNRVITAPVAAMNLIAPGEDPFAALIKHSKKRQSALDLCQQWHAQAVHKANEYALELPSHTSTVINAFIEERLRIETTITPPITTGKNELQRRNIYRQWRNYEQTSSEVI